MIYLKILLGIVVCGIFVVVMRVLNKHLHDYHHKSGWYEERVGISYTGGQTNGKETNGEDGGFTEGN